MWQVVAPIGSLLLTAVAAGVSFAAFRRSARAEDARTSAEAAKVGLDYLRESLRAQQETIVHQEGEIGVLRGELKSCKDERQALADRLTEIEGKLG